MKMFFLRNISLIIFLSFVNCSIFVDTINLRKNKVHLFSETELSKKANDYFWDNFHKGNYDSINRIILNLSAAYNENPNDLRTVGHLAFANIWKLSERQNLNEIPPTIIDHATLALKYFGESYKLNPKDSRILGFLAVSKMTVGNISDDEKLSKDGYFDGLKSIREWSEFNRFTIGYNLSQLPYDSKLFSKALEWQWKTLDECYCEKFNRNNPNIEKYLQLEKKKGNLQKKRACWNSWITPHNVEGFFLNMGDMIVKSGDWKKAIQIYKVAKQVPQYESWDYGDVLETRITNAESNVSKFRMELKGNEKMGVNDVMLINSSISCMACHKMSLKDFSIFREFDYNDYLNENIYGLTK